jgi:hypothetical protein
MERDRTYRIQMFHKKKREQKIVKKTKTSDDTDEEDGVYVGVVRIKITIPGNLAGEYQYGTGTARHTTNEFQRLSKVEEVNIEVEAHDGTESICKKRGTLILRHNGREIKLKDTLCLYKREYNIFYTHQWPEDNRKIGSKSTLKKELRN